MLLGGGWAEDTVEGELVLAGAARRRDAALVQRFVQRRLEHLDGALVDQIQVWHAAVPGHFVRRDHRTDAAENADVALQLLYRVVQLPAQGLLHAQPVLRNNRSIRVT